MTWKQSPEDMCSLLALCGMSMVNLHLVVEVVLEVPLDGYLRRLMDNAAVVRFLSQAEPAMLTEFQRIIDTTSMQSTG